MAYIVTPSWVWLCGTNAYKSATMMNKGLCCSTSCSLCIPSQIQSFQSSLPGRTRKLCGMTEMSVCRLNPRLPSTISFNHYFIESRISPEKVEMRLSSWRQALPHPLVDLSLPFSLGQGRVEEKIPPRDFHMKISVSCKKRDNSHDISL